MFSRIIRFTFLSVVFTSGVLIGGIYTPEINTYNKAKVEQKKAVPQKARHLKKSYSIRKRTA